MKYIRTNKDKIYHISDKESLKLKKENPYFFKIIKESDKLEELCDEFIWENRLLGKGNVDFESKTTYVSKGGFIPFSDWEYAIYGAIWTKGEDGEPILKSVAKMNGEGELELL